MIMVLTLMIYSVAEWKLREKLKEKGEIIPDQLKKTNSEAHVEMGFHAN